MKYKTVVTETYWNGTGLPRSRVIHTDERDFKTALGKLDRILTTKLSVFDYGVEKNLQILNDCIRKVCKWRDEYYKELSHIEAKDQS